MTYSSHNQHRHPSIHCFFAAAASVLLLLAPSGALAATQAHYQSPQEAVDALVSALKDDSIDGIVTVLGPEGRKLAMSGDPVADEAARKRFESAYEEAHEIKKDTPERATLVLGKLDYPFPIPIVAANGRWRFDTPAGADELLTRRIGENELTVIKVMQAFVDAQKEYAEADRDGKGVQYARKFLSSDGKQDGLYWPTTAGESDSPLGPLIADAQAEGYTARKGGGTPFHGYVFKILTRQGKDAAGGARDYVVNGRMIGGYALVAAPAEYGNSGVMTFMVDHDGVVYEKNLGPDTTRIAAGMSSFNPDASWHKVAND